eukprot:CAMPEP_0206439564 /NCGR_PEP_ID=MMETSP0324_2-20121206/12284_1 /ASSEMBLY_ACC=CAM_ASM_000836 /TAXON_ID=2866 /ORGANISM="Crypthecodinium cohnii, Strain Seligo" /LENGTH=73 /DNA_ID=CAMNT_0053907205 /DNA_START=115 /DNA_END=336 /DNA_ORIENTATION=-
MGSFFESFTRYEGITLLPKSAAFFMLLGRRVILELVCCDPLRAAEGAGHSAGQTGLFQELGGTAYTKPIATRI